MPRNTPPQLVAANSVSIDPDLHAVDRAAESGRDGMERDVSNILAALNQAELAKIVAAARAAEAKGRDGANADGVTDPDVASLPPGLGQAASALTSIASASSNFKRTPGTNNASKDTEMNDGSDYLDQDSKDFEAARTSAAIAAAKSATDSATAAAIASLGSLAAASGQTGMDHDESRGYDGSESPSSQHNGLKRSRGPEMDRQRKDNHKEVERRRRSAINEGIISLSHIVPGCDSKNTNKGAIINAAVRYIQDLKHNEASNIEKWTLEKLLMDQAMGDLNSQLEELRRENDRLRTELEDSTYAAQTVDPAPQNPAES